MNDDDRVTIELPADAPLTEEELDEIEAACAPPESGVWPIACW